MFPLSPRRIASITGFALVAVALGLAGCSDVSAPSAPQTEVEPIITTVTNSWAYRADMPTARKNLVAAAVNGLVYAIGGDGGLSKVEAYNPATNTWTTKAALLDARRYASGAAVINGKIYVPGGTDGLGHLKRTLLVYNPGSNTWQQRADMPVPSADGVAAAIGGKLYVFTPRTDSTGGHRRLHRYDPASNSWTELAMPPHEHRWGVGGAMYGKFYVVGGYGGSAPSAVVDVYDPASDTWATKTPMPTARYRAAGGVVTHWLSGDKLYVVGGSTSGASTPIATAEAYNPVTDSWTTVASMQRERRSLAATGMGGKLYALGGERASLEPHKFNEVYTR